MDKVTAGKSFALWTGLGLAVSLGLFTFVATQIGMLILGMEEGPLEQAQEALLVTAAVGFLITALRSRDALRMASNGAAALCIIFFFRELELPVTGDITAYLKSRAFRWHEAFVLFAIFTPYIWKRRDLIPTLWRYVISGRCWPFIVSGVFLLIGDVLDKKAHSAFGGFMEEMAEYSSYLVLMFISLLWMKRLEDKA